MELSNLSQVKLLNKELQALREAGAQAAESLQKAEAEHMELERKLQGHTLELQGLEAMKDARCVVLLPRHCGHRDQILVALPSWLIPLLLLGLLCKCSSLMQFLFRIKDLEEKLHSLQLARKRAEETFRRK